MFILISCYEREMTLMGTYNSLPDARVAMHEDIIAVVKSKLNEQCANIVRQMLKGMQFEDNFSYTDGYDLGVYSNSAWATLSDEHFDWRIFEIGEEESNEDMVN